MELGIYSFGEATPDPETGRTISAHERVQRLLEEIELADKVGLDVYGLGEHHRREFVVSAPAVVLAAAASRTKRIRLTSAVSVISSDDPVRVFQNFATLDLVSNGRAEIMAGRGSFTESFPLFGYDLADYDDLFEEKLELLLKIRDSERVTWRGNHRAPIEDLPVFPRPVQDPLPVWIAVGGHPESVVRAGRLGLPLALAIIGGEPRRFVPLIDLYREAGRRAGHDPSKLRVSINSHGFIEEDSKHAAEDAYAAYSYVMAKIGRERGWPPPSRAQFEAERGPLGANLVGTPDEVAAKILYEHELFGLDRFLIQLSVGTLPHEKVLRAIELFGTKVAPIVRREVERRAAAIPMPAGERV
ncbi:MAG TPA: LLM class flavin-dependent oxidoreductase [Candidatus Limnocylindria bacterium]|nr:LLM class flavin-dependent oxidoreductase [Candidatus Limnocylindria bacterium]